MKENFPAEDSAVLAEAFFNQVKQTVREVMFETNTRCDGRSFTDLRKISCEIDLYKPLHGSSLFQRGQTQVMCTLSLDSLEAAFKADPMSVLTGGPKEKNFMLHYEFPPYATNDIGRLFTFGRREIGHGALAEKALRPLMPNDFHFTTRLNCEVLESNGSSSMASVCAGSLALMDAGIPITEAAAGVALGLVTRTVSEEEANSVDEKYLIKIDGSDRKQEFRILVDIAGIEDFFGDMDFKLAGTKKCITALQLDVKLAQGLPMSIIVDSLTQGFDAKNRVLAIMNEVIDKPNENKKENWPILEDLEIPAHKRRKLFGFGGSNLKRLSMEIGFQITQDEENINKFKIFAPNQETYNEAIEMINKLLATSDFEKRLEFKGVYSAKIVEVLDTGVKITLYPEMAPAFLPNRELDQRLIRHPSALGLQVGDEIMVKYFGRDPSSGEMRISRRALITTTPRVNHNNTANKN